MSPGSPRKRATITDVAREAGVVASTVSRSFTNPGRVNQVTRDHVLEVAKRLGYTPNPMARALESGRTETLALLVPDITNPCFAGIIKGAEGAAARSGRTLVLGDTQESAATEAELLRRLGPAVDGFVLSASRLPDSELRRAAELNNLVLLNRAIPGITGVVADFASGTRQIIDHLASHGHRSAVFLAGPPESWSGRRRWAGLEDAAHATGMTVSRLGPYAPTREAGAAAADAVITSGTTAAVCHNDMLALGVIRRLLERGVRVPEDVSIVGFDNIFGADLCTPTLTTLAEHTQDAGARAVDTLIQLGLQRTRTEQSWQLPTHLVVRGSTGPCRIR
ncbi:MAG TPA: LacI family DNA-binding transcriptional regulator [Flexivirga sp.]|uniref:LacI family DNA-binding transcriptional regulator n=1 Tax=Flexivirga sp. TaxID=1962927 RepID=UPI002C2E9751|nr:LacI family DNA-binding transcriptional regulator [Flexivirga sp.]HWC23631.1 LacI family DNA-binding transcriptional regulator [Flexivirga sp.]